MAITCQPVEAMQTYAASAIYRESIPPAKIDAGVIPLDSLPADWWNWLWYNITLNEGRTVSFLNAVFSEITSVYTAAGITPSSVNTDDLKKAIEKMCQVVATGVVPGSVLSSTLSGKLAVAGDGTATINGLGTPSSLQTTADNVVAAINEVLTEVSNKAPIDHASTECTYGIGSSSVSGLAITRTYGHVSLSCCINPLLICPSFGPNYLTGMAYSAADARDHVNCPARCTSTVCVTSNNCKAQMGHVTVIPGCGLSISGGVLSLDAPGYNCVGNITKVCFNGNTYVPTSGVINLGRIAGFPGYGSSTCAWSTASQVGTSTLVARADHSHGCPWANGGTIEIGCCAKALPYGIAIGYGTCTCSSAVAIGYCAKVEAAESVALGYKSCTYGYNTIALGYRALSGYCKSVKWSMIKTSSDNGRVFVNIAACCMQCDICKGLRAVVNAVHCSLGYSQTSQHAQCIVPLMFYVDGEAWNATMSGYGVSSTSVSHLNTWMIVRGADVRCPIACQASCRVTLGNWDFSGTDIWSCGASFTVYF